MSETSKKHKTEAPKKLKFGIFTCSTSRYTQVKRGEKVHDLSGDMIESMLRKARHTVLLRRIVSDDPTMITEGIKDAIGREELDAVIFCGGTGITLSDVTIETVAPFLDKTLPGFGEIFRRLSYDEIGSAAILSRTIAGIARGKAVFCIPGSPNAVQLCLSKLILPEAGHLIKHARE
ncbi:MAG: MogA/MoaB family molybdenum cofactor biosynthesis protein [Candidatus Bathyarchaeia archaeon]|jgi:molybdenum cofactor biosynthesis protein B